MTEKWIHIKNIDEAKELVNQTINCNFNITLISDDYSVDAKSIMGIFSLDLEHPILLKAGCDENDPFMQHIAPLIIDPPQA